MRIAVVFDTPYKSWTPEDQHRQMLAELAGGVQAEPEMEYQAGGALEDLEVIAANTERRFRRYTLKSLLPDAFKLEPDRP